MKTEIKFLQKLERDLRRAESHSLTFTDFSFAVKVDLVKQLAIAQISIRSLINNLQRETI